MPLLTLNGVSKRFDGVTAVDQVSFAVDRGQVVGFLGPNGAGKTTTMRLITQFYEPDEGAITLDGTPLAVAAREAKRRIGYLAENNPLYEEMLVADYLAFIADLRELGGASRARSLDEAVTPSIRSEEHTSELQSPCNLVCRLLLEKKKKTGSTSKKRIYRLYT